MQNVHELYRGHQRLKRLIAYALEEGWTVTRTHGGHLKFVKPGLPPIYSGSTISDYRGERNAQSMLKRAKRQAISDSCSNDGGTL